VVVAAAGAGCHKQEGTAAQHAAAAAAAAQERPPAAVVVAPAVAQDVPVYLDEIGKTVASEFVTIRPQVGGKVTQIHFKDGASVKKGDLLFTIDPRPFQAALNEKKAQLAQAKATLSWAQSELKRVQGLSGTGAISAQEIESKQNAVAVADAQVQSGEAAVETAQLNLEYCQIHSPIDGRAGRRMVDVGNVVNSSGPDGGSELLTITRLDPMYAEFTVTENELSTVRKFMAQGAIEQGDPQDRLKVTVEVPGDAGTVLTALGGVKTASTQPAQPTQAPATQQSAASAAPPASATQSTAPREGMLTFLDNLANNQTGTIKCRATVPNSDHYFWPGVFVNCRLVLTVNKGAVLVPRQAQQVGQQGPFVYVVKPDMTAEMRPVRVGQAHGDKVVVEGVSAGEQVVVAGQMGVMPGGKVAPINTAAQQQQQARAN
jgi:multidrug efflux system membrane fusion protein